jgi:hypothetical protein
VPGPIVRRITARAALDPDVGEELDRVARAARDGDESWARWLQEYRRGDALILELDVTAHVERDGHEEKLECRNPAIWVENDAHPPCVERQVSDLAEKDFGSLARQARQRGMPLSREKLELMHVTVTLAPDVLSSLREIERDPAAEAAGRVGWTGRASP